MINQELIDFANFLADKSAQIAKKYFRLPNGEREKEDNTPVTKADREIEAMMRDHIQKKYPNHGIIGEEYDNINEKAEFIWVLDPIDGTSSFIIGRPIFGTLISLTRNKKPILGIVNQPITNERWLGIKDQGAWFFDSNARQTIGEVQSDFNDKTISLNGNELLCDDISRQKHFDANSRQTIGEVQSDFNDKTISLNGNELLCHRIKTRKVTKVADAVMGSSSPYYFQNEDKKILEHLTKLTKYQKIGGIIYGGDCYSFACLAMGLVDVVIEPGLKCYDYAATQIIIEEAGGIITDWQGNDLDLKSHVRVLACGNKELHENILQEIKNTL